MLKFKMPNVHKKFFLDFLDENLLAVKKAAGRLLHDCFDSTKLVGCKGMVARSPEIQQELLTSKSEGLNHFLAI